MKKLLPLLLPNSVPCNARAVKKRRKELSQNNGPTASNLDVSIEASAGQLLISLKDRNGHPINHSQGNQPELWVLLQQRIQTLESGRATDAQRIQTLEHKMETLEEEKAELAQCVDTLQRQQGSLRAPLSPSNSLAGNILSEFSQSPKYD